MFFTTRRAVTARVYLDPPNSKLINASRMLKWRFVAKLVFRKFNQPKGKQKSKVQSVYEQTMYT